jgi:hypothetical protein
LTTRLKKKHGEETSQRELQAQSQATAPHIAVCSVTICTKLVRVAWARYAEQVDSIEQGTTAAIAAQLLMSVERYLVQFDQMIKEPWSIAHLQNTDGLMDEILAYRTGLPQVSRELVEFLITRADIASLVAQDISDPRAAQEQLTALRNLHLLAARSVHARCTHLTQG